MKPKKFEFFLASLMSHSHPVADAGSSYPPSHAPVKLSGEEEEAEFWASPSLTYFEQRLQLVGSDTIFDVALPVQAGTRRHRFLLSLWPGFQLGVLTAPDGMSFYPHFVRWPRANVSLPAEVGGILPWSATLEEVLGWYGPPFEISAWDFRRWVTYSVGTARWAMTFDLGLVQSVSQTVNRLHCG